MNHRAAASAIVLFTALCVPLASAQSANERETKSPAAQPEPQLPPGWTEADMQAFAAAATPGEMQEFLSKGAGVWLGKTTMWMAPGAEPIHSESTSTIKSVMDGRYFICEMKGDIPGMGPFNGYGIYAYDNVSENFEASWIDNHSTGIMTGTGELSPDRKTLTWTYTYDCPIRKSPTTLREVERIVNNDKRTLVMYSVDPKSGQEFKSLEIAFTRQKAKHDQASAGEDGG